MVKNCAVGQMRPDADADRALDQDHARFEGVRFKVEHRASQAQRGGGRADVVRGLRRDPGEKAQRALGQPDSDGPELFLADIDKLVELDEDDGPTRNTVLSRKCNSALLSAVVLTPSSR